MPQSHTHQHADHHAPLPPPSTTGSVVLEIGDGTGAVIIHTAPAHDGVEIEVSPDGSDGARTHAAVRPRHLAGRTLHCAVISPLPTGRYTVWKNHKDPVGTVEVRDGHVTETVWP